MYAVSKKRANLGKL